MMEICKLKINNNIIKPSGKQVGITQIKIIIIKTTVYY